MMDEDQTIDEVGKFYATIYDGITDFLEQIQDQLVNIPCDTSEQKLAFARIVTHFTLCRLASELQRNEQGEVSPSIRYYLFDNGEEIKELDELLSPIMGWLSDIVPGEGLLGIYGTKPLPTMTIYDLALKKRS